MTIYQHKMTEAIELKNCIMVRCLGASTEGTLSENMTKNNEAKSSKRYENYEN